MELHIVEIQGLLPKGGPKGPALVRFLVIKKEEMELHTVFASQIQMCA